MAFDVHKAIGSLLGEAMRLEMVSSGYAPAAQLIEAGWHLDAHDTSNPSRCGQRPCPSLAVARALHELQRAAGNADLPSAVLALASASHAAVKPLREQAEALLSARTETDAALAAMDADYEAGAKLALAQGAKKPDGTPLTFGARTHMRVPHDHEALCWTPQRIATLLERIADELAGLDEKLRDQLRDPRAQSLRIGKKQQDGLLVRVTQHLHVAGGYTAKQVAELIDDGGGDHSLNARAKRAHDRFRLEDCRTRWDGSDIE